MKLDQLLDAMVRGTVVRVEGKPGPNSKYQGFWQRGRVFGIKRRNGLVWIEVAIYQAGEEPNQTRPLYMMVLPYEEMMFT